MMKESRVFHENGLFKPIIHLTRLHASSSMFAVFRAQKARQCCEPIRPCSYSTTEMFLLHSLVTNNRLYTYISVSLRSSGRLSLRRRTATWKSTVETTFPSELLWISSVNTSLMSKEFDSCILQRNAFSSLLPCTKQQIQQQHTLADTKRLAYIRRLNCKLGLKVYFNNTL